MNPKQKRFADEYLIDLNATAAYKRAGYSGKGNVAKSAAQRLLTNVDVSQYVKAALEKASTKNGITVERTLQELARLAYSDIRKLYGENGNLLPVHELDDDAAAMLAGVEVVEMAGGAEMGGEAGIAHVPMFTKKVKIYDKNSALDKAMKYLKMIGTDNQAPVTNNNLFIMDDNNRLEVARRIAFVLARGAKLASK